MVGFPLLLIPLAVFNIVAFLMPDVSPTVTLFRLHLMSGTEWPVTLSDVLIALGMLLLLLEIIKGARPGAKFLMDHLLSLVVFGAAAAEFVLWPKFGNSTFFLLTLLALVDFIGGIALRTRRSVQYALVPVSSPREKKRAAAAAAEEQATAQQPRIEPAPAMPSRAPVEPVTESRDESRPSAASVAESVLSDHPAPKAPQPQAVPLAHSAPHVESPPQPEPAAAPAEHSPQVASPELQPANSAPATPDEPQR